MRVLLPIVKETNIPVRIKKNLPNYMYWVTTQRQSRDGNLEYLQKCFKHFENFASIEKLKLLKLRNLVANSQSRIISDIYSI